MLRLETQPCFVYSMNVEEIYFSCPILHSKFVQVKSASQPGIHERKIEVLNNRLLEKNIAHLLRVEFLPSDEISDPCPSVIYHLLVLSFKVGCPEEIFLWQVHRADGFWWRMVFCRLCSDLKVFTSNTTQLSMISTFVSRNILLDSKEK